MPGSILGNGPVFVHSLPFLLAHAPVVQTLALDIFAYSRDKNEVGEFDRVMLASTKFLSSLKMANRLRHIRVPVVALTLSHPIFNGLGDVLLHVPAITLECHIWERDLEEVDSCGLFTRHELGRLSKFTGLKDLTIVHRLGRGDHFGRTDIENAARHVPMLRTFAVDKKIWEIQRHGITGKFERVAGSGETLRNELLQTLDSLSKLSNPQRTQPASKRQAPHVALDRKLNRTITSLASKAKAHHHQILGAVETILPLAESTVQVGSRLLTGIESEMQRAGEFLQRTPKTDSRTLSDLLGTSSSRSAQFTAYSNFLQSEAKGMRRLLESVSIIRDNLKELQRYCVWSKVSNNS
ncbi:hypothetical protein C8R46DRAFT_1231835 [Mycena filopes]|nr:hypothetical protein C8R46DRAFT_1231835 [Mycena filopes]